MKKEKKYPPVQKTWKFETSKMLLTIFCASTIFTIMSFSNEPNEEFIYIKYDEMVVEVTARETIIEAKDTIGKKFISFEEMPMFPGGEEARLSFLKENLNYPTKARKDSIQGTVFVSFVVERNGSITNVEVLRGIGGGCDEEAVRVTRMMPNWVPGKQRGKPVRTQFRMPIRFSL